MRRIGLVASLLLAACSGRSPAPRPTPPPPRYHAQPAKQEPKRGMDLADDTNAVARDAARLGNWPVKIGKPYQVAGIIYYPADDRNYREEGVASWYGPGFHAGNTANGERYDQDDLTAAHRTLPMPSWVEVENLDNGRKLTVRINDRGPFARGRIIDLSRKAAQLLGVDRAGTARVRLTRVYPAGRSDNPPLVVASAPAAPVAAAPAPAVTIVALPPSPAARPAARAASGGEWLVQVAALSDAGRVAWLSGYLASFGPVVTQPGPNGLVRVRLGPFGNEAMASAALAQVRGAGYVDARVIPPQTAR
ncbi:septal ring lytic transglycosylase RlpA family lipoprotein [Sphingomonas sp. IBVSS1]|nr:septal ring lytic transglycosylase RlpA family lipoprotein [Sphingomonas sp. IBVSS1]